MKKQINKNRKSLLLTTVGMFILLGTFSTSFAQTGIGAKYGAREPRTCEDTKAPAKGAITAALAAKYFICASEQEDYRYLYLVENVKVDVGGGIPYAAIIGHRSFPEVDVKSPVYPIRGSHTQYQCNAISDAYERGKNCMRYEHKQAKGYCYKTTFGDWRCHQSQDSIPNQNIFERVPPPGGTTATEKMATNDKPGDTKNVNQTADTKNVNQADKTENKTNAADRDANGFVKPDFSELEKDFEIVRYEYDTSVRPTAIYVVTKVKKPNGGTNALGFEGHFYDADGVEVMLPAERVWAVSGDTTKAGSVVKLRIWGPSEKQLRDDVKKISITRKIE